MKIGIDGRYAEGDLVGIGKYIKNLAEGLSRKGNSIVIFYSRTPVISLTGRRIKSVTLNTKNRYFFEQILLPVAFKKYSITLYHATGNFGVPLFTHVPSILTLHDIIPLTTKNYFKDSRYPRLSLLSYYFRVLTSCIRAKKIITISNFVKEEVENKLFIKREKLQVINSGIKMEKPNKKWKFSFRKYSYVLNNGGIAERKNMPRLLRAFKKVLHKNHKYKLVITGKNEKLKATLKGLAKRLKIDKNVLFVGYVSEGELWSLLKYCSCLCYPSLSEGYGLPILEGFAARVPVVTSNTTSIPEVADDAAVLVNPLDTDALARNMISILRDKNKASLLRKKGISIAKKYTWKKTVEETFRIYKEALI